MNRRRRIPDEDFRRVARRDAVLRIELREAGEPRRLRPHRLVEHAVDLHSTLVERGDATCVCSAPVVRLWLGPCGSEHLQSENRVSIVRTSSRPFGHTSAAGTLGQQPYGLPHRSDAPRTIPVTAYVWREFGENDWHLWETFMLKVLARARFSLSPPHSSCHGVWCGRNDRRNARRLRQRPISLRVRNAGALHSRTFRSSSPRRVAHHVERAAARADDRLRVTSARARESARHREDRRRSSSPASRRRIPGSIPRSPTGGTRSAMQPISVETSKVLYVKVTKD